MNCFVARIGLKGQLDIRPETKVDATSPENARSKRDELNAKLPESADDRFYAFIRTAGQVKVLS
jgi:hypothetical protein